MFKHLGKRWRKLFAAVALCVFSARGDEATLEKKFATEVRPFLEAYCLKCHDGETKKADLDLSRFGSLESVLKDYPYWELVLERLQNGDMPPAKSKQQPTPELRRSVVGWIEDFRKFEAHKYAGDPGPVPARRLSNAEYDYTIRDLTGVDIRPTRSFPVDPANQAGFDNSGESLATSPALVKKYLEAAREVADHLALLPAGFTFASHPVVADTDRDKWGVFRIVEFYRRQPTDFGDYFLAAWRYQHRASLGEAALSLTEAAKSSGLSTNYLALVWKTLTESPERVGPIAKLQGMWRDLPLPGEASLGDVRSACREMRDYVARVRQEIIPEVKNLDAPPIQIGAQALVLWKDRQMAANRRKFDPGALRVESGEQAGPVAAVSTNRVAATNAPGARLAEGKKETNAAGANPKRPQRHVQAPTPEVVQKGGFSFAPTLVTRESSATAKMAAGRKKRGSDPELVVSEDPKARAEHEAAFARFADVFPDAFYITERGRVYMDAEKEQENAGRLLSAGFHSMTGYFRDDGPLYDLILDEAGRAELDRLWDEFDFVASVPQRMHTSMLWFERTDSAYLRDPEFDPYRPEDKSALTPEKIQSLGEKYLAKAQKNNASDTALGAIREHFAGVAANIRRVDQERVAAVPSHLRSLEQFAERAYRRPLTEAEKQGLRDFYDLCRKDNGLEHEDAMRDSIVRVLMSPHFSFRMDLVEAAARGKDSAAVAELPRSASKPLSADALASRLSYFLWASMPDDRLRARAAAGELNRPEVLRAEARRLLQDARVRNFATEFGGNWLDFRRFEQHNSVDRERFPAFNNELRSAMFEEPIRFLTDVVQSDRSILDLLYGRDTFVNPVLARHYQMPALSDAGQWTHVPDARAFGRGGLLPMSVFLTANSPGLRTSPVKRGNWVVKRILGERIPPPPATVPQLPADEKKLGDLTLREALAQHRDNPACAGCHARFDSFGLVFESFGPVGERREKDLGGRAVDTRAEFPGGSAGEGLEGLIDYIRGHREPDFVSNFCRKLLAYALGRTLILSDEPLVEEMRSKLAGDQYRFSALVDCIVASPQFLLKRDYEKLARN